MKKTEASPLKHHCDNSPRQDAWIDTTISRQKCEEKRDICSLKVSLPRYLFIHYKGKNSNMTGEKLGRHYLNPVMKTSTPSDQTHGRRACPQMML